MHGRPWKTHQRAAAELMSERLDTGRYRYPVVVISFPRQCAKTTTVLDLALGRCRLEADYRVAYCAQTGHKTTEIFGQRFTEIEAGPLADLVKLRRSAGTERISFVSTRSYVKAFPPIAGALRSDALDLVIVDEAQEIGADLGEALDQTIIPTFTTRPRRQLVVVGTAGTDTSVYFRRYLDQARTGRPGFAVIEYGAGDAEDFLDESLWPVRHPGLATGLTDTDALRQALEVMGPAGFLREYGNVWTKVVTRLVDPADWAAILLPTDTIRPTGRICLGVSVDADRSGASIAVAADNGYREVVDFRPGTDWTAARALELAATHGAPIAVDRYGATGTVADALELAGADLMVMKTQDVANATADVLDAIPNRTLRIYPAAALTDAVAAAATRPLGDTGGVTWSHRLSAAPISPLVALTAAGWGFDHLPPPVRKPVARV
jgi:hypothetical protein